MRDSQCMRFSLGLGVDPFEGNPITGEGDVSGHLNGSRFKITSFKRQSFLSLRRNPVGYVILMYGRRTNGGPADEIFVPKIRVRRQVVSLYISPVGAFQVPQCFLIG